MANTDSRGIKNTFTNFYEYDFCSCFLIISVLYYRFLFFSFLAALQTSLKRKQSMDDIPTEREKYIYRQSFRAIVMNGTNKKMAFKQLYDVANLEFVQRDHSYGKKADDVFLMENRLSVITDQEVKVCISYTLSSAYA